MSSVLGLLYNQLGSKSLEQFHSSKCEVCNTYRISVELAPFSVYIYYGWCPMGLSSSLSWSLQIRLHFHSWMKQPPWVSLPWLQPFYILPCLICFLFLSQSCIFHDFKNHCHNAKLCQMLGMELDPTPPPYHPYSIVGSASVFWP